MSLPFLLEIGTEEIPDWMIVPALNNLQDMFQALLDQQALGGRVTAVDATPRRLVLASRRLVERQADIEELVPGPYKSAGPGAAAGFAKKWAPRQTNSAPIQRPRVNSICSIKRTQGQATAAVLARELPNLILKIQWPKTMVWNGKGTERFIRPIRWLVALLGDAVVPFEIGGVKSGNTTVGHRVLGKCVHPSDHRELQPTAKSQRRDSFRRRAPRQNRIRYLGMSSQARSRSPPHPDLHHRVPYPDPRQLRSQLPRPAAGSAGHCDAASSEVFVGGRRRRQARAALHRGDEHRLPIPTAWFARATSACCARDSTTRDSSGIRIRRKR